MLCVCVVCVSVCSVVSHDDLLLYILCELFTFHFLPAGE